MKLLLGLESQPDFPREDLTRQNARLLSVMLESRPVVDVMHGAAEEAVWLYKVAHPAVVEAGRKLEAVEAQLQTFDYGVMAYEAIAAMVQATPVTKTDEGLLVVKGWTQELRAGIGEAALSIFDMDEAGKLLYEQMPLTAEAVRAGAACVEGDDNYAIIGAGVARQFELSAA